MGDTKSNKSFDFWNDHSLEFLEMAMKRDYQERVESCDGIGKKTRECGDAVTFFLKVDQGRIQSISYDIQGCLYSHACANTVIRLTKGNTIESAKKTGREDIIKFLKTLPEAEAHCADHALSAFLLALENYEKRQGDPEPAS